MMDEIIDGSLVIDEKLVHLERGIHVRIDEAFGGVRWDFEESEL